MITATLLLIVCLAVLIRAYHFVFYRPKNFPPGSYNWCRASSDTRHQDKMYVGEWGPISVLSSGLHTFGSGIGYHYLCMNNFFFVFLSTNTRTVREIIYLSRVKVQTKINFQYHQNVDSILLNS